MKDTMKGMYIACANTLGLGDFTQIKKSSKNKELTQKRRDLITTCLEGYNNATDSGDEEKRSAYISALMLMFWAEISKMADKCKAVSEYEYDDFASKLYECINSAASYYKADKEAGKAVNAEAYINKIITSRGAPAILYESNLDKAKANYNTASLDATINDDEGHEVTKLDLTEDEDSESFKTEFAVNSFIQSYIDKNKIIEGIILDTIATNDCAKHESEIETAVDSETGEEYNYAKTSSEFWAYKVVQILSKLPENYFDYFYNKYDVQDVLLEAALDDIKHSPNTRLYKVLAKTLEGAKTVYQN